MILVIEKINKTEPTAPHRRHSFRGSVLGLYEIIIQKILLFT